MKPTIKFVEQIGAKGYPLLIKKINDKIIQCWPEYNVIDIKYFNMENDSYYCSAFLLFEEVEKENV